MKKITLEDIEQLQVGDTLFRLSYGKVHIYSFLSILPKNNKYVIILDQNENPIRILSKKITEDFYLNCSRLDILSYCRDYTMNQYFELCQEIQDLHTEEQL